MTYLYFIKACSKAISRTVTKPMMHPRRTHMQWDCNKTLSMMQQITALTAWVLTSCTLPSLQYIFTNHVARNARFLTVQDTNSGKLTRWRLHFGGSDSGLGSQYRLLRYRAVSITLPDSCRVRSG